MNTLDICAIDSGMRIRKPVGYCSWLYSSWFLMSLSCVVAMAIFTGIATSAPMSYLLGQIVLSVSVYISFSFLADRPLLNPIQGFVAMFYWWFGVGPAVIATWNLLLGKSNAALDAQISGIEAVWIVAPGLILYAIVARWTLDWFSKTGVCARFLLPAGNNYRPTVLASYLSLIGFSMAAIALLKIMGIQGKEEISFLGGARITIWWVGVIVAMDSIAPFVSSALMFALTSRWKTIPMVVWILIGLIVTQTIMSSLFGGWKSPIAFLGAYFVCAYVSRYQRPPWLVITVGALLFLVFITPYVTYGRHIAITSGAEDSAGRKQIFSDVLDDPEAFLPTAIEGIDVSVFFRGIYPLAGELTRRNGCFGGEWHGETISWGMDSLIPRVLNPDKRDMSIGNFFARTIGVDIGVSGRHNTINSISISIPFEFVGNYGIIAGILSFGLIGFLWTLFIVWILSPERLSNHPLTPFFVMYTITMEQPVGHYLANFRDMIIPLFLCFIVYKMFHGKI